MTPSAVKQRQPASDPNALQQSASDPTANVWVMASAGTGKTTVLVRRYIRLLLSQKQLQPEKILCLTYTKAAATQMKSRILSRLAQWVCMEDAELRAQLTEMTDDPVSDDLVLRARRLFGMVLDRIDHLNILTIHAFCQSLLARFQIEADLDAGAAIMNDADKSALLERILRDIMTTEKHAYLDDLARVLPENGWHDLFNLIKDNRDRFEVLMTLNLDVERHIRAACNAGEESEQDLILDALRDAQLPHALLESVLTENKIVHDLRACPEAERGHLFPDYWRIFFTTEDKPKAFRGKQYDEARGLIEAETRRLSIVDAKLRALRTARMSISLFKLSRAVLERYELEKSRLGLLDYDDLIIKAHRLLSDADAAAWVRYKLDGGIDHVLLDEAQDTSPAQWHIIEQIVQDYFAGISQHDPEFRTLFVVGDTKQSIYSFQGADPETTAWYHRYFSQMAQTGERPWADIPLDTSFRTAQDILHIVDACGQMGLWDPVDHRAGKPHAGRVELHVLQPGSGRRGKRTPWALPEPADKTPLLRTVNQVADRVADLLNKRIALPSKNDAPLEPHDILILLRTRKHFPIPLIQALRQRNIPVSGLDSFELTEDIAVQDMLSLLRWSLFPDERLALAEILTSPFVGMDHETMRQTMLDPSSMPDVISGWLQSMRKKILAMPVAEALHFTLEHPCPADPVSGWRAMTGRLGTACRDPLTQLMAFARQAEPPYRTALPFLRHLERYPPIIKREMEGDQAARGVRIMTVHGAKGLEAPIVILPDTTVTTQALLKSENLQWASHENVPVPLWGYAKGDRSDTLRDLIEAAKRADIAEYHRLLYVAMTRAKDGLFLYGFEPTQTLIPESWYESVSRGLQLAGAREEDGAIVFGSWIPTSATTAFTTESAERMISPESRMPLPDQERETVQEDAPIWRPDRALSIGRQWHTLMERAMMADDAAIKANLGDWLLDLPDLSVTAAQERIATLRAHPQYGFLFRPDGAVEVPFITRTQDGVTRGRIDRLVRTQGALWILDYKTRLNLNNFEQKRSYTEQMRGYTAALRPLAGDLPVYAALVDIALGAIHPLDFTA